MKSIVTHRRNITAFHPKAFALKVSGSTIASLFVLLAFRGTSPVVADEVTKWNETAGNAAFDSGLVGNPLFESRVYAITHAAIHDALNAIDRRFQSYGWTAPANPDASPEAAVATAAHAVL